MLNNEFRKLRKENSIQVDKLSDQSRNYIKEVNKSMSIFKINSYEKEIINRDLIGMAEEIEIRNSSLKKELGDNPKSFSEEILASGEVSFSPVELCLSVLRNFSIITLLSVIFLSLFAYGNFSWDMRLEMLLVYFMIGFVGFLIDGLISPMFAAKDGLRTMVPLGLFLVLFRILNKYEARLISTDMTKNIGVMYIIGIFIFILFLVELINSKNIQAIEKKEKTYISNLNK